MTLNKYYYIITWLQLGFYLRLFVNNSFLHIWLINDSLESFFVINQTSSYLQSLDNYTLNIMNCFSLQGVSLALILLTKFIIILCFLFDWNTAIFNIKETFFLDLSKISLSLLLEIAFLSANLLLFFIAFELVLIPMFFIIAFSGSKRRKIKANFYLFMFTLFGSVFILIALLLLQTETNMFFSYFKLETTLEYHWIPVNKQILLALLLFFGFSIKIPLFPFHIWLPEAHVEAPTTGSVILASLLLKLGGYAYFKFLIPIVPLGVCIISPLILTLASLGTIFGSLIALRQLDVKRIIAYSSIAHMNFAVLGLFSYSLEGIVGALFLMLAHGFVSAGMFFVIGILYKRYKTKSIAYFKGLVQVMPLTMLFFFFLTFANIGFPLSSNFVGEFLILLGLMQYSVMSFFIALISLFLGGGYAIWLYNRIAFGTLTITYLKSFTDLKYEEFLILLPLTILTFFLGLLPNTVLTTWGLELQFFLQESTY